MRYNLIMRIENNLTDKTILEELGRRLSKQRLGLGITQGEVATRAGLGKRTVERIEADGSAQIDTLVRILRALNILDRLDSLIPDETTLSPMNLLKLKGKERQRVSVARKTKKEIPAKNWIWGD